MRSPFDLLTSSERVHSHSITWKPRLRAAIGIVAALTSMTGCRSSMPKFNMFGFKSEPSADALAGSGPTTTYPLSPSSAVSPEAIASAAAGTGAPSGLTPQTSNIASTTTPGSLAATPTNQAAAAANGFYGQNTRTGALNATPASFASNTGAVSGFNYGQNPAATTSPSTADLTGIPTTTGGVNARPASFSPSGSAVPAYAQGGAPTTPPTQSAAQAPAYSAVPGYSLPGTNTTAPTNPSAPSFAMPTAAPITVSMSAPTATSTTTSPGGFTMPGATRPDATIATAPAPTRTPAPTAPSTGYTPGSTAGAVAYPSSGSFPSTGSSDTFYR
jgi:hypothetical protein